MTFRKSLMALLASVAMVFAPLTMAQSQATLQSLGAAPSGTAVGATTTIGGVPATAVSIGNSVTWVATSSLPAAAGVAAGVGATAVAGATATVVGVTATALVFTVVATTKTTPATVTK